MKDIKIIHFPENCIGCNSCVIAAPDTWHLNHETGKAELIGGKKKNNVAVASIIAADIEVNEKAAEACPMRIIKVEK